MNLEAHIIDTLTPVHGINKDGHDHGQLYGDDLKRMYCGHRPRSRLKVPMVETVKMFEQKLGVKRPMNPIRCVILCIRTRKIYTNCSTIVMLNTISGSTECAVCAKAHPNVKKKITFILH